MDTGQHWTSLEVGNERPQRFKLFLRLFQLVPRLPQLHHSKASQNALFRAVGAAKSFSEVLQGQFIVLGRLLHHTSIEIEVIVVRWRKISVFLPFQFGEKLAGLSVVIEFAISLEAADSLLYALTG